MLNPFGRSETRDGRIPDSPQHWDTEAYIPADPRDLILWITRNSELDPEKLGKFLQVIDSIRRLLHDDFRNLHDRITHGYRLVDPDIDDLKSKSTDTDQNSSQVNAVRFISDQFSLDEAIEELLVRANYRRLNPREIQLAMQTASHWGVRLRVRLSMFRRLRVYGRGDIIGRKSRRHWRRGFRLEEVDVPIFRRLVLLFRVKESQTFQEALDAKNLHLRMFKNIPKLDVDMLLPAAGIRMSWLDKGKIGIPTAWGFTLLVIKLAKSLSVVAVLGAFRFLSSVVFVIAVASASVFYGIRSFFSYLTAKRRHLLNVAQNLYYQNLDNNLGVLLRILEEAEQQEMCEAVLTYYTLSLSLNEGNEADNVQGNRVQDGQSEKNIHERCISILRDFTGLEIAFDVKESLRYLLELRVIESTPSGFRTSPIEKEAMVLDSPQNL